MRPFFALLIAIVPSVAVAQSDAKKATLKWVLDQEVATGGFLAAPHDPKLGVTPQPGLRATSAAVRTIKYLNAEIPHKDKHAAFVLKCFDRETGGFAEPGGKPDVTLTSVGVMAATELDIPKEKYAQAMDYLKANAKTFEDVCIGAAAVEAWGVKDCPFKLKDWGEIAVEHMAQVFKVDGESPNPESTRDVGSSLVLLLRLAPEGIKELRFIQWKDLVDRLQIGQGADGGFRTKSVKTSDIETTYRVMRAFVLLKDQPKDTKKLREFIESHRNEDGGYGSKPGGKSNMGATYYATTITKWLDATQK